MIVLNLLSTQGKKRVSKHHLTLILKDIIYSSLLVSAVLGIMFVVSHHILIKNFVDVSQNSLSITKSNQGSTSNIRQINQNLKIIDEIQKQNINWTKFLLDLNNLIPKQNIQITNLEVDYRKNSVLLQGKAVRRDDFLKLKENLENSNMFKNITSPLSNILLAENINFKLEMELEKQVTN